MRKIKTGDYVVVLTGKFKGHKGKVEKVITNASRSRKPFLQAMDVMKVQVEGVTQYKTVRGNPAAGVVGEIKQIPRNLHISNIALVNPKTGKADRVGIRVSADGKKVRYFKSNGENVV